MAVTSSRRRLSTIAAAAEYASCSPKTIRRRISDGSLTGYRMGSRLIRIDLDELDQLLRPIPTGGAAGGRGC
ncbi:excisionase family DNA-binding protein [Nocardioides sp.]|uniref:excisionase family DNA-binding protein n=1 Tax=Nocardioides sp. TaxID=35761 RepID=UPI003784E040